MKVESIEVGPIQTNCYLIEDSGELVVVDPGDELYAILDAVGERAIKEVWVTHYHWDHVGALAGLEARRDVTCAMGEVDAAQVEGVSRMGEHDIAHGYPPARVSRLLREGDVVSVGSRDFQVIETPGHSPGSICYYCAEEGVLLAGDTLFAGGRYGRTDFPDGSFEDIVASMRGKLSKLPDETVILSGHGPASTMGRERARNPYLR